MPTLSRFLGIVIYMYFEDHNPPHFHARYGKAEALIDIKELRVFKGSLPRIQLAYVLTWASFHQAELLGAWDKAVKNRSPGKIAPLAKGRRR